MIDTERLILRPWRDADVEPFMAATNTPAVMRWLGGIQNAAHYAAAATRMQDEQAEYGHCFWMIEQRATGELLGFCGIRRARHPGTAVCGKPELGWRLRESAWRQGIGKEAALAAIDWGWANLADSELVAYTVPGNTASCGLMEALGMRRRPDFDFDHPMFPNGHELCRHIVYSIERPS